MLTIIAYALLILGLPILIGGFTSTILILILGSIVGEKWEKIPDQIFEIIDGVIAMLIALLMFKILKTSVTFYIPIILSIISFIWLSARNEKNKALWSIIGIWCGWILILIN